MDILHRGHDLLQRTWSTEAVVGSDDYPQATKHTRDRVSLFSLPMPRPLPRTWSTEAVVTSDDYPPSPVVSPVSPVLIKRVSFNDTIKQLCYIVDSHMKPLNKPTKEVREARKAARKARKAVRKAVREAAREARATRLIGPTQI
jgi:hypothetical protein